MEITESQLIELFLVVLFKNKRIFYPKILQIQVCKNGMTQKDKKAEDFVKKVDFSGRVFRHGWHWKK